MLQLSPVTFNWKSEPATTTPHTGFIAQDVAKVYPDLVSQSPDGYLSLNYAGLTPYFVKSVQEIATISGPFKASLIAWLGDADDEREQIGLLKVLGHSIGAIARALRRPKSTISRN